MKLGCCDVGRGIIEDWLARRPEDSSAQGLAGYTKVLELYCLQVLPRLGEWEYTQDFLQYEREMEVNVREVSNSVILLVLFLALIRHADRHSISYL